MQLNESTGIASALEELLTATVRGVGWRIKAGSSRGAPEFLLARGPLRYAVELKVVREARRSLLQATLADAVLRARYAAKCHDALALPILGAPLLSDGVARELHDYMAQFAPGEAYGLIDARSRFELRGEGLSDIAPSSWPPAILEQGAQLLEDREADRDLFSDRNRWLFKVLLAQLLPPHLLRSPRERIEGGTRLARAADVPAPTVSRFLSAAQKSGFVEVDGRDRALRVVRVRQLLEEWRGVGARRPPQYGARWILLRPESTAQSREYLSRALASFASAEKSVAPRACLGLFAACDQLGLGFVHGVVPHLYVEGARRQRGSSFFERLGLRVVDDSEQPDVIVREPPWPESVFRAAVDQGGVLATDVVQCWLDVSHDEARGSEQAQRIWDRVLAPRLLGDARP